MAIKIEKIARDETTQVIYLRGRIVDIIDTELIVSTLEEDLIKGYKKIVYDLEYLEKLSSVGLALLLKIYKLTNLNGGSISLSNISPQANQVLESAKLKPFFNVYYNSIDSHELTLNNN